MSTQKSISFRRKKRIQEAHRLREEEGLTNGEIANRLVVSLDTVNDYFRTKKQETKVHAKQLSHQIMGLFIDQGRTIQEIVEELHVSPELVQVCIQSYPYLGWNGDKEESLDELKREVAILGKQMGELQEEMQRKRRRLSALPRSDAVPDLHVSRELVDRLKAVRKKYIGVDRDEEKREKPVSHRRDPRAQSRKYRPIT